MMPYDASFSPVPSQATSGRENMPRLRQLLGVLASVSPLCLPVSALDSLACPNDAQYEAQMVPDESEAADEVWILELLQVSTKLERRGGDTHKHLASAQSPPEHQSVFGNLLDVKVGWTSFALAVVLPHVLAISVARFLRRRPENAVQVLREEEQHEDPRSAWAPKRIGLCPFSTCLL